MQTSALVPSGFAKTGLFIRPGTAVPTRFQVLGERSSGTNYVKRLLGRNTPLSPVETLGWKHGPLQAMAVPRDMVVLVSVRNPADWALSMFAKPWHTPAAMQALPFSDFLRAPWATILDHPKYFEGAGPAMIGQPLQQDRDPATGLPYDNLFQLRIGKLRSHLSLINRGCSFVLVRQETAVNTPKEFLHQFRTDLGLPPSDAPLRPVVKRLGARFNAAVQDRPAKPEAFPAPDREYMRETLDLALETALGYDV